MRYGMRHGCCAQSWSSNPSHYPSAIRDTARAPQRQISGDPRRGRILDTGLRWSVGDDEHDTRYGCFLICFLQYSGYFAWERSWSSGLVVGFALIGASVTCSDLSKPSCTSPPMVQVDAWHNDRSGFDVLERISEANSVAPTLGSPQSQQGNRLFVLGLRYLTGRTFPIRIKRNPVCALS